MASNHKILKFIAYAKICSSKLAYQYVMDVNYGKDASMTLLKLKTLKLYINILESNAGLKRRMYRDNCGEKTFIYIQTCLSKKEICNIVNKIKSNCLNC